MMIRDVNHVAEEINGNSWDAPSPSASPSNSVPAIKPRTIYHQKSLGYTHIQIIVLV